MYVGASGLRFTLYAHILRTNKTTYFFILFSLACGNSVAHMRNIARLRELYGAYARQKTDMRRHMRSVFSLFFIFTRAIRMFHENHYKKGHARAPQIWTER